MKIKLHYVHPNNYGNLMMASAFIDNFTKLIGKEKAEYFVDINNEVEMKRLNASLENSIQLTYDNKFDYVKNYSGPLKKVKKLFALFKKIQYNRTNFDCHIYLGGDCISEYYGIKNFIMDAVTIKLISKKSKSFLVGQTLGPFSSYRKLLAKICLKNSFIYTRDDKCYDYLKDELKLTNIYRSRDLAFLDIPHQNNNFIKKDVLEKFKCNTKYIAIVASGLIASYTSNEEAYIQEYIRIIENIMNTTSYKILLLAHVIHNPNSDDTKAINGIMSKLDDKYKERIIVIDYLIMPHEARLLLGNAVFTITGRMHAAVSSLNMGVIPICLSYSVKYEGVVGRGFDLMDLIIECRDDLIWENGKVSKMVNQKVKYILDNKETLEKEIKHKLKNTKEKSLMQIQDIAKRMKCR